ncbi:MAG TPA: hypothetical protein PLG14_09355, partial [Spirochaetales bacterium]|nr:hypothetical protein [Spirochaetales bacterium]
MAGRSATQLVDIRLVEERRIEESYFQDYAKVHERLERIFEKTPKPLPPQEAERAAEALLAWLSGQAEKSVPVERLTQFLRSGLGHICVELAFVPNYPPELVAARAYDELRRRGWTEAVFDPLEAAEAAKRLAPAEKKAPAARAAAPKAAAAPKNRVSKDPSGGTAAAKSGSKKEDRRMSSIEETGVAPVAPESAEKKAPEAAKKPAPKKAAAPKKPAAKKAAPAKKAVAKKPVAKKAAPAKKAVAKKPVAKKAAPAKK